MPPAQRQTTDDQSSDQASATELKRYVVLTDALTVTTRAASSKKKAYVLRTRAGAIVALDPELTNIDRLIALKAIAPYPPEEGVKLVRTNARAAVEAAGAARDEALAEAQSDGTVSEEPSEPVVEQEGQQAGAGKDASKS